MTRPVRSNTMPSPSPLRPRSVGTGSEAQEHQHADSPMSKWIQRTRAAQEVRMESFRSPHVLAHEIGAGLPGGRAGWGARDRVLREARNQEQGFLPSRPSKVLLNRIADEGMDLSVAGVDTKTATGVEVLRASHIAKRLGSFRPLDTKASSGTLVEGDDDAEDEQDVVTIVPMSPRTRGMLAKQRLSTPAHASPSFRFMSPVSSTGESDQTRPPHIGDSPLLSRDPHRGATSTIQVTPEPELGRASSERPRLVTDGLHSGNRTPGLSVVPVHGGAMRMGDLMAAEAAAARELQKEKRKKPALKRLAEASSSGRRVGSLGWTYTDVREVDATISLLRAQVERQPGHAKAWRSLVRHCYWYVVCPMPVSSHLSLTRHVRHRLWANVSLADDQLEQLHKDTARALAFKENHQPTMWFISAAVYVGYAADDGAIRVLQSIVNNWPADASVLGTMLTAVAVWRRHDDFRNAFLYLRWEPTLLPCTRQFVISPRVCGVAGQALGGRHQPGKVPAHAHVASVSPSYAG